MGAALWNGRSGSEGRLVQGALGWRTRRTRSGCGVLVEEMGTNTSLSRPSWAPGRGVQRAGTLRGAPYNRAKNTTLLWSMSLEGMGPSLGP